MHNRAGSNMTWGVATALLEQRGDEGLFEVDEAWLPRVAADLSPRLIVLGNLFRDQLDRYGELEHLADEWAQVVASRAGETGFALCADDPLVADLGRDGDLATRPGVTYFGIDDPSQALPELQHAFDAKHCRRCGAPYAYRMAFVGHLGHYSCPNCGADRPKPDVVATRIELQGMRGSRVAVRAPAGEAELSLPLPGLYNVYNALAALTAAIRLDIPLESAARALETMKAVFGRVETIDVGGTAVSILLIKNPAGANEVLRTLLLESGAEGAGCRPRPVGRAERPDRGRTRRLMGVGRRLRASRRSRAACGLRRYASAGDGGSTEVRGRAERSDRARALDRALAGPRSRRSKREAVRAAHLHGAARASQPAVAAGPGADLLDMSSAAVWHEVECGGYAADLPAWERLADGAEGPLLELGCGTGRVALHLARAGHELWAVDADPALLEALEAQASRERLPISVACADVRSLQLEREFELIIAPMQLIQMLGGAAARRALISRAVAHLTDGGRLAMAVVEDPSSSLDGAAAGVPDVRERDGWVYSSLPTMVPTEDGGVVIRRLRQTVAPNGALSEEDHVDRLDGLDAETLEEEAIRAGLRTANRVEVPPTEGYLGATVVIGRRA